MLKKVLVMFGMVAAFVGNAGAALTPVDGCYLIGTADELKEFAGIVNGSVTAFTGCAKLTADIFYLGSAKLLNDAGDGLREDGAGNVLPPTAEQTWTPLKNFAGTFDGQGHSIYGLYVKSATGAGFIQNTVGSATIQNLHIADSYFYTTAGSNLCPTTSGSNAKCPNGAGGFVAYADKAGSTAKVDTLKLEKCSFSGYVDGASQTIQGKQYVVNGGLLGSLDGSVVLKLTNSYNDGYINGSGLIGTFVMKTTIIVDNCYSIGNANSDYPLIGKKVGNGQGGLSVSGNNLGCKASVASSCKNGFTETSTQPFISDDMGSIIANYWKNLYGEVDPELEARVEALNKSAQGLQIKFETITIEYQDENGQKQTTTFKAPVAVLDLELSDAAEKLVMPEDLQVYGVRYNRTFTKNQSSQLCNGGYNVSTTVLPFTMESERIEGAIFYEPVELKPVKDQEYDGDWAVGLQRVVGKVWAHTPYIVCPTEDHMTFTDGDETIVQQADGEATTTNFERKPVDPKGSWSFVGLYKQKRFTRDCPEGVTGEDCDAGRVYAFKDGEFIRVGNGMSVILRAYILAPYGSKPTVLSKAIASASEFVPSVTPERLLVEVLHADEDKYLRAVPKDEFYKEEGTTAIRQPLIFPVQRNNDGPWFDMKGRAMNRKPSAKGIYLNNKVPVMVK